jgi:CRISPR-associated exonuclease Cas4
MHPEDDLLPLSGLQHLVFCERQCALIHIEQAWEENRLTAEGRLFHERVHEEGTESRGDIRIAHGVRLCSSRLGLIGIADVVEFHRVSGGPGGNPPDGAAQLTGVAGLWRPFPVEYKRGKPKPDDCDEVQLCAQAMSLEEMLDVSIPNGALFYGSTHRRKEISFVTGLRERTVELAERLHNLIRSGVTPAARYEPKCDQCSLFEICRPKSVASRRSALAYLDRALKGALEEDVTEMGGSMP